MLEAQTERSVITVGIVLSLAGVLTVALGIWDRHESKRFHANARRVIATVVPGNDQQGALHIETEEGTIELPVSRRGFHYPPGTTFAILYEPDDLRGWQRETRLDPWSGVALGVSGCVMFLSGAGLLLLGWISRRRNQRPFWQ